MRICQFYVGSAEVVGSMFRVGRLLYLAWVDLGASPNSYIVLMLLTQLGSSNYSLIILYTAILYHVTGIYSSKSLYSSTLVLCANCWNNREQSVVSVLEEL